MDIASPGLISFVLLTFMLGGVVKGVTGMGLPTVAMGLLATVAAPHEAASLLLLPSLATNLWQIADGPDLRGLIRRFWLMMAAVVIGTLATARIMTGDNATYATAMLGATLALYAMFGLSGRKLPTPGRAEAWLSPQIGFVTGAVTGATGVFVMPAVPYLQALGLEKDDLVQALGLSFTVSTIALAIGIAATDGLDARTIAFSGVALLPACLGMALGQILRRRISPETFKRVFFAGLFVLGIHLLRSG